MNQPTNSIKSEDATPYLVEREAVIDGMSREDEDIVLAQAREIVLGRFQRCSEALETPQASIGYIRTLIGAYEHEVFGVLMLDNRNRVIAWREMFRGTVDGASVYPREVVKQALADNAAAVILAHNHPSGIAEPSQADIRITERLKKALALVDIRVLDHMIIGEMTVSLAERGMV